MNLFKLATDPEQYTQGEAQTWISDSARQKIQHEIYWQAIKEYIDSECKSAIDIGCGSGWAGEKLTSLGIKKYVGLEPSLKNYEIAKHEHPELTILRETWNEFKLQTTFDLALAIMMFSHIANMKEALKKIYLTLSDSGKCISVVSRFHLPGNRHERNGRLYDVEEIDAEQYVDKSINGTGFGIADINREPNYYIRMAKKCGFREVMQTEFSDQGYSPKILFVFIK